MDIFGKLQEAVDRNGDGKISKEDLEALKEFDNNGILDKLKSVADQNNDGKISLDDAKNIDLGGTLGDIKDKLL